MIRRAIWLGALMLCLWLLVFGLATLATSGPGPDRDAQAREACHSAVLALLYQPAGIRFLRGDSVTGKGDRRVVTGGVRAGQEREYSCLVLWSNRGGHYSSTAVLSPR